LRRERRRRLGSAFPRSEMVSMVAGVAAEPKETKRHRCRRIYEIRNPHTRDAIEDPRAILSRAARCKNVSRSDFAMDTPERARASACAARPTRRSFSSDLAESWLFRPTRVVALLTRKK